MRDFDLRALQLCELDILKEFVRLCEKNHLQYYLAWGTLLGAVRHQGFIPWDDDIDVCMPWKDYVKFKEICKEQLSDDFFYEDWYAHPDYYLYWAKLRKNNTTCMTRSESKLNIHWGVGMDIFPLFRLNQPSINFSKKMTQKIVEFVLKRSYVSYDSNQIKRSVKKLLYAFIPKSMDRFIIEHGLAALDKASDEAAYIYDPSEMQGRSIWSADVFGKGQMVSFEQEKMIAPVDADTYLRKVYGSDYMVVPEAEKRIDHGDIIVDLLNDYSKYR